MLLTLPLWRARQNEVVVAGWLVKALLREERTRTTLKKDNNRGAKANTERGRRESRGRTE
jgi:hypothetical protein